MPPTLEKLKGHIALGLSVRPSVRASVTKFIKFHKRIPHQIIIDTYFFKSELHVSPFVELCPF